MPETQTVTPTPTVFDLIRAGVEKEDPRFHRRMDAYWLKQYVADGSDYAEITEDRWKLYADATAQMVEKRKVEKIKAAMAVLESAVNGQDKDLVVQAMANVHPHLFNELIGACMMTVKKYHMKDGRIGMLYRDLADSHFI